jgi:TRAP-type C4-dicarboxylate transport system permease small subunit
MQSSGMEIAGLVLWIVYVVCAIAIVLMVLRAILRFVSAHERMASSLEIIARKLKDDGRL